MTARRIRSRRTAVGLVAVLLLWPLAASAAFASTGIVPGSDRAAAVQAVLDRVLGPGNSTVVVSDTIQTSATRTTSVRWGSGAVGSIAQSRVVTATGTSVATTQQHLDGSTTTVLATPAGSLVDQSVSVVVDRAHLGATSVATLTRLVTSAAGVVPSRGDRVSVVVARFARPAAATAPAVSLTTMLLPYAVPAIWALGAVVALLILAAAARRGRRPVKPGTGVQRA